MEKFKEALQNCDTVKVILTGVGEKQFATNKIFKSLLELERLAEIGAKIEKVFKDNKVEGFLNATWDDGQISSYSGEFIGLEELLMFSEEEE